MEVAAQGSSNSMPPFLTKTYDMVEDPSTDAIVSWGATNKSFIVWHPLDFSRDLLPKFFKHNNFSSFIRQLNTYGFRKIDAEKWEFANDDFIRGQQHLLKNIHRRKPIHSHSLQNAIGQGAAAPLTDPERQSLKDQIEKLQHEKEQLRLDLQREEQERKMCEMQLHSSKERLEKLEQKQQSLISSVSQVLQKPGVELSLWPLTENTARKRRFPRNSHFSNEASAEDSMVTSQVLPKENAEVSSDLSLDKERFDLLESSMMFWENVVNDLGDTSIQSHSNIDFDESMNCADSPGISCVLLDVGVQPKSPEIDMNSEEAVIFAPDPDPVVPAVVVVPDPDPVAPAVVDVLDLDPVAPAVVVVPDSDPVAPAVVVPDSDPVAPAVVIAPDPDPVGPKEKSAATTAVKTSVNDVFWRQFLSDDEEEEQEETEKKDYSGRHVGLGNTRYWWNIRNVNRLR